jgi:hypothetical protein
VCGATAAQTSLQTAQANFYSEMTANYSTVFGEDQQLLNAVTNSMAPIIAAGVNQQGFSPEELQVLNTQATEGVATSYAQAQTALQERQAALGGDAPTTLASGETLQLSGELAADKAATQSASTLQIEQADYAQGRQNYFNAVQEEENAAGLLNPTGYSGAATSAGTAEGTTANQIAQANNSVWSSVMSGLGGIAGAAVGRLNVGPFGSQSSASSSSSS